MSADQTFPFHKPSFELERLAQVALADLEAWQSTLPSGANSDAGPLLSAQEQEAKWQLVQRLCAEGFFLRAAPIAALVASNLPNESRFQTLAGRILRHLGENRRAMVFFARALAVDNDAAAAFRLGDCMAACGQRESAMKWLEWAREKCRDQEGQRDLRHRIADAIAQLDRVPKAA